ncbi:MAG: type II toxin-antitoxin system VapC family toxin [Sulfuriferula sp.]
MSLLLDTCILSEMVKKTPHVQVINWFNSQQTAQLFISSISIAEINKGLFKIQDKQPARYAALCAWLQHLETQFLHRILPVSDAVLQQWSAISAQAELQGGKLAVMDSLIAATALHHQLSLVTRNVADFNITGLVLINPYLND